MSIRLVRASPETPNEAPKIQNKDDAKMIRYAYGGYEGVVKGFGQECAYTFENGIFKIGSGRIVLQGWEVDIDEFGWSLDLSNVTTGEYYYVVYLEVKLPTQQANLNYKFDSSEYPDIERGDDLTTYPNGISSLVLYSFRLRGGKIFLENEEIPKIKYLKDCVSDFGDSIDSLGDSIDSLKLAYKSGKLEVKYAKYAFGGDDSKGTIEERLNSGLLKSYTALSGSISITEKGIYAVYYHDPAFTEGYNSSAVLCIPDLNVTVVDASTLVKYDSSTKTIVRYRTNAVVHSAYLIARL